MNSRCVAQARGIVFLKMDFPEQLPGFGCERVKPAGHVAEEQRVLASRFPGNVLLAFEAQ